MRNFKNLKKKLNLTDKGTLNHYCINLFSKPFANPQQTIPFDQYFGKKIYGGYQLLQSFFSNLFL